MENMFQKVWRAEKKKTLNNSALTDADSHNIYPISLVTPVQSRQQNKMTEHTTHMHIDWILFCSTDVG